MCVYGGGGVKRRSLVVERINNLAALVQLQGAEVHLGGSGLSALLPPQQSINAAAAKHHKIPGGVIGGSVAHVHTLSIITFKM